MLKIRGLRKISLSSLVINLEIGVCVCIKDISENTSIFALWFTDVSKKRKTIGNKDVHMFQDFGTEKLYAVTEQQRILVLFSFSSKTVLAVHKKIVCFDYSVNTQFQHTSFTNILLDRRFVLS